MTTHCIIATIVPQPSILVEQEVGETIDYNKNPVHKVTATMSTLEQIESAILTLPTQEFQRLREWLLELDQQHWDQQLEQDVNDGKLDALAAEAIAEFDAGECREI